MYRERETAYDKQVGQNVNNKYLDKGYMGVLCTILNCATYLYI